MIQIDAPSTQSMGSLARTRCRLRQDLSDGYPQLGFLTQVA